MAEDKKHNNDTMRELRDWLVTKCRLPGFGNSSDCGTSASRGGNSQDMCKGQQQQFKSHMVTPRTIPQFIIPGSNESSRQPSIGSNDDLLSHSSGDHPSVSSWSASTSPGVSPRSSFSALAAPENTMVRVRSAPVSPRRDSHGFLKDFSMRSMTNLPQNQNKSNELLPNVIRKSSAGGQSLYSTLAYPTDPRITNRKGSLTIPSSEMRHKGRRSHRSSYEFCQRYERSVSSDRLHVNHSSMDCRGMYTGLTDKNEYLPMKESFRRSKRYYRRRSSLATADVDRLLIHRNSTESHGYGDGSPPYGHYRKQLAPIDCLYDKRHSSPDVVTTKPPEENNRILQPLDKTKSNSLASLVKAVVAQASSLQASTKKSDTERGEIKFSFQYFPATKRLKVIIIKLEGLRFPEKPESILNPFVKLCLMPGKIQKQSTEPVRQTCAPIMNKEFFFTDLSLEEMKNLRLRIKTFHKPHHLKLPDYIGEVNVPLSNHDLLMENRMWSDLHFKPYKKTNLWPLTKDMIKARKNVLTGWKCWYFHDYPSVERVKRSLIDMASMNPTDGESFQAMVEQWKFRPMQTEELPYLNNQAVLAGACVGSKRWNGLLISIRMSAYERFQGRQSGFKYSSG